MNEVSTLLIETSSPFYHMRAEEAPREMAVSETESVLTRHQTCLHLDLRFSSLWNREKYTLAVKVHMHTSPMHPTPNGFILYSFYTQPQMDSY